MQKKKGFTLMEVVIVLAVIAILSAIVIPNYTGYTERSRLRSDIQSTRVIQAAIDLHKAETGRDAGVNAGDDEAADGGVIENLLKSEYLSGMPELQTEGAEWVYDANAKKIRMNIFGCSEAVKKIELSDAERIYVTVTEQ